jgi:hypothetical protein
VLIVDFTSIQSGFPVVGYRNYVVIRSRIGQRAGRVINGAHQSCRGKCAKKTKSGVIPEIQDK